MEFAGPVKYNIVDPPAPEEPEPEEVATEIGEVIQTREDKDPIVEQMMSDELEDALPKFKPKPAPDPEMFEEEPPETLRKPRVRKVKEPDEPVIEEAPTTKGGKRKGYNKNGKKRKPMSEEHKAKLALAREKALEKKRYLKQKRAEEKAEKEEMKALETKVETKRKTKKKQELIKELEDEVEDDEPQPLQRTESAKPIDIPKPKQQFITREDLEKAQLSTLVAYEQMRKARKAEKKKKQQEEEYQEQVKQTIQKINGWQDTAGIYGNCF